ncbi:hypothetical protein JCM11641_003747 [Rhodosporidiobolus odoratus]
MDGGPALTIAAGRPRRQRRRQNLAEDGDDDYAGARRLKVKVGQGGPGRPPNDAVGWDRELDSDPDEPLAIEEQFILRVPPEVAPKLREQVDKRDVPADVWFKFKDSRRAVFHAGDKLYGAKLVDLPALLESQRLSGSGGQTVKVADISQMLLVEEEIREENQATREKVFNIEDFVYPHGITPPLKHVRKRRFRKRINRRTIEQVEEAVEKLLEADARAEKVQFEMLDYDVPSDDEDYDPAQHRNADLGSVGAPTPRPDGAASSPPAFQDGEEDQQGEEEEESDEEGGSGYDSDLAKEIELGLNAAVDKPTGTDGSDSDDGDGLFGGSSDDDEEEEEETADAETLEARRRLKLLGEEMQDLDKAIAAKQAELSRAANPIFKKRFEDQVKKFHADRDLKQSQHAAIARELDQKREAAAQAATAEAADPPSISSVAQPVAGTSGTPGSSGAMDTGITSLRTVFAVSDESMASTVEDKEMVGATVAAAQLSEEAMDLVCSYVRDFKDDREAMQTLHALCRVSKRWLSSAHRSLWHDPTRVQSFGQLHSSDRLLNILLRRPHLAQHVRKAEHFANLSMADFDERSFLATQNCYLAFWTGCVNITSMSLNSDVSINTLGSISVLAHLRRLRIKARRDGDMPALDYFDFLSDLCKILPSTLQELELEDCDFLDNFAADGELEGITFNIVSLSLVDTCDPSTLIAALFDDFLPVTRHLRICATGLMDEFVQLPPSLTSFSFIPDTQRDAPHLMGLACGEEAYRWPMPEFTYQPNLTHLTVEYAFLDLNILPYLADSFPSLVSLDLRDSTWHPCPWLEDRTYRAPMAKLLGFIDSLPSLQHLSLGHLPLRSAAIRLAKLEDACLERGIALSWQPFYPPGWCSVSDDDDEVQDGESSTSSSLPDWCDSVEEERSIEEEEKDGEIYDEWVSGVDDPEDWETWRRTRFPNELQPSLIRFQCFTPPASPSISSSHYASPPPSFRSPMPTFLEGPSAEPRFEQGYEATDEVELDELEEAEGDWRKWTYGDSLEEGDQAWNAFEEQEYGVLE